MKIALSLVLILGCAARLAAQPAPVVPVPTNDDKTQPIKRTSYDDCLGKIKSPRDIESMQLHALRDADRSLVGEELAGVLACDAAAKRAADPCAGLKEIGKAIGGGDKQVTGRLERQCVKAVRFARFYEEALRASANSRYPACLAYFKSIPLVDVRPGFESICARISLMIQNKQDDFCSPVVDPYVKDKSKWPMTCKIVGDLFIRGDGSNCSFFPDPKDCSEMAAMVPAFQGGRPDMCGNNLAGGICHAFIPSTDRSVPRCKLPWVNLSHDYCKALVSAGAFNNPVKGRERQGGAEQQAPDQGNDQAPDETAPSEGN